MAKNKSRDILISPKLALLIIVGAFLLGFVTVFAVNHFGKTTPSTPGIPGPSTGVDIQDSADNLEIIVDNLTDAVDAVVVTTDEIVEKKKDAVELITSNTTSERLIYLAEVGVISKRERYVPDVR